MLKAATGVLIALFAASAAYSLEAPAAAPAPQWVMGYYVGYQESLLPPANIDWRGLSHIVMSPLEANADGTLDTTFDIDSVNGPKLAKQIAALAHQNGKKALLMLGGSTNGSQIASAVANHLAAFEANLISAMNTLGYDGIDLDWEDDINYPQFVTFATELRQQAPNAILTMPVGPLNLNYETVDPHIPTIAAKLDHVDVMSYSPATDWAGSGWLSWFNAPLGGEKSTTPVSIVSSLQAYAKAGVPRAKLGMGTSFYAICYTGGVTGPNQSTENGVSIAGGDNSYLLSKFYGQGGDFRAYDQYWYAAASEPYLTLPTPNSYGCKYVSYENEAAIRAKGLYSRNNGYGGIIIWTINEGYVASHPQPNFLLDAFYKSFLNPSATLTVGVSIMQGATTVKVNAKTRFAALVTGTTTGGVTWSVVQANCGAINASGTYTAPHAATACTVKATSKADATKSATVAVTVSN